jgi:hypothetical protein
MSTPRFVIEKVWAETGHEDYHFTIYSLVDGESWSGKPTTFKNFVALCYTQEEADRLLTLLKGSTT